MYLPLVDQTFFTAVHKLYRVLDGQDMCIVIVILVIHHCGKGGRLTGTGRPSYQNQTSGYINDISKDLRTTEVLQCQYLGWYGSKDCCCTTGLIECIDTKAS